MGSLIVACRDRSPVCWAGEGARTGRPPVDVVVAELLLSASQAFVVGVLFYLAVGVWDDRGVGAGSVAVIVVGLAVAVGGGWLYWLLGGVGWPLAAADVPGRPCSSASRSCSAWRGDDLFRVEPRAAAADASSASVYGIVCGVFLDSPRRLRWDQRRVRASAGAGAAGLADDRACAARVAALDPAAGSVPPDSRGARARRAGRRDEPSRRRRRRRV